MNKRLTTAGLGLALASIMPGATQAAASAAATNQTTTAMSCAVQAGAPVVSGSDIVAFAEKYLGSPYVRSGRNPQTGFSDLGFVRFVYRSEGIALPGNRRAIFACAAHLGRGAFQPGDVVYFRNTIRAALSHVGIYVGGGKFVHPDWRNRA